MKLRIVSPTKRNDLDQKDLQMNSKRITWEDNSMPKLKNQINSEIRVLNYFLKRGRNLKLEFFNSFCIFLYFDCV